MLIFSLVLILSVPTAYGQYSKSDFSPYWELNLNGGFSTFFGDLKQNSILPSSTAPSEWKLGGGFMFGRQHSPVFGFRFQLLTGELLGTKQELDRFFESNYYEANLNATINLNNLFGDYKADRKFNFYLVGGIGLNNYNSVLKEISTGDVIAYHGYGFGKGIGGRTLEGVLLAGVGVDYTINDKFSVTFESVSRGMNSDMLDVMVDAKKHDFYNYTSFGITYKFGKSKKQSQRIIKSTSDDVAVEQAAPKPLELVEEVVEKPEPEPEIIVEAVEEEKPVVLEKTEVFDPEYRVQIRALFQKRLSMEALSSKYNIPLEDIKESIHNGYYIYTIGSMETYIEARTFRDRIRSVNGVHDAFVVAFSKGKRLSKLPKQ